LTLRAAEADLRDEGVEVVDEDRVQGPAGVLALHDEEEAVLPEFPDHYQRLCVEPPSGQWISDANG